MGVRPITVGVAVSARRGGRRSKVAMRGTSGGRVSFWNGALDLDRLVVDVVHPILKHLVHSNFSIEGNESEAARLIRFSIIHNLNGLYFSERAKIFL